LVIFSENLGDRIKLFSWKSRSIIAVNQEPVLETPRFIGLWKEYIEEMESIDLTVLIVHLNVCKGELYQVSWETWVAR